MSTNDLSILPSVTALIDFPRASLLPPAGGVTRRFRKSAPRHGDGGLHCMPRSRARDLQSSFGFRRRRRRALGRLPRQCGCRLRAGCHYAATAIQIPGRAEIRNVRRIVVSAFGPNRPTRRAGPRSDIGAERTSRTSGKNNVIGPEATSLFP